MAQAQAAVQLAASFRAFKSAEHFYGQTVVIESRNAVKGEGL